MTENNVIPKWPILPTFIMEVENDKNSNKPTDELAINPTDDLEILINEDLLNERGIVSTDFMQGFLTELSRDKKIKNPVALFEFVPGHFLEKIDPKHNNMSFIPKFIKNILEGEVMVRLDLTNFKLNTCCKEFRKCLGDGDVKNGVNLCYPLDSLVGLWYGLKKDGIEEKLKNRIEQNKEEILSLLYPNESDKNKEIGIVEKKDEKVFISYLCPHSQLYEYSFPIFIENNVVGVIIIGQIFPNVSHEEIGKRAETICTCLIKSIKNYGDYKTDSINKECLDDTISKLSKESGSDKNNKLEIIVKHINGLEERLEKRVRLHRYHYVNNVFSKVKYEFESLTFKNH